MGQQVSCPCNNSDNVDFQDEGDASVDARPNYKTSGVSPTPTNLPTSDPESGSTTNPFDTEYDEFADKVAPIKTKEKSVRTWEARPKDTVEFMSNYVQRPGEEGTRDGGGDDHTPETMGDALRNVKGEITFNKPDEYDSSIPKNATPSPKPSETTAQRLAREKREAHEDRIVATFNSVMMADGLKVLKHHRRTSKKAASRVIRFVPDYGGALVWDKPLRQPGAKASRVPLDAINQVELEQRIVWISAGDERVGFETTKVEDADLMYQAICILVDRCHA